MASQSQILVMTTTFQVILLSRAPIMAGVTNFVPDEIEVFYLEKKIEP